MRSATGRSVVTSPACPPVPVAACEGVAVVRPEGRDTGSVRFGDLVTEVSVEGRKSDGSGK